MDLRSYSLQCRIYKTKICTNPALIQFQTRTPTPPKQKRTNLDDHINTSSQSDKINNPLAKQHHNFEFRNRITSEFWICPETFWKKLTRKESVTWERSRKSEEEARSIGDGRSPPEHRRRSAGKGRASRIGLEGGEKLTSSPELLLGRCGRWGFRVWFGGRVGVGQWVARLICIYTKWKWG